MRRESFEVPVIFYTDRQRPMPQEALALTTRPDELMEWVFQALERRKQATTHRLSPVGYPLLLERSAILKKSGVYLTVNDKMPPFRYASTRLNHLTRALYHIMWNPCHCNLYIAPLPRSGGQPCLERRNNSPTRLSTPRVHKCYKYNIKRMKCCVLLKTKSH